MIGKVVVFFAVAVSCAAASPFGNCGPWDTQILGNLIPGPSNAIPNINFQAPPPMIEAPSFPGNLPGLGPNVGANAPVPCIQSFPQIQSLPGPQVHSIQGPSIQAPVVHLPRVQTHIQIPQVQNLPGPIMQEARFPTITRLPTIQRSIPNFETAVPNVQQQIFPGHNPFTPC